MVTIQLNSTKNVCARHCSGHLGNTQEPNEQKSPGLGSLYSGARRETTIKHDKLVNYILEIETSLLDY